MKKYQYTQFITSFFPPRHRIYTVHIITLYRNKHTDTKKHSGSQIDIRSATKS